MNPVVWSKNWRFFFFFFFAESPSSSFSQILILSQSSFGTISAQFWSSHHPLLAQFCHLFKMEKKNRLNSDIDPIIAISPRQGNNPHFLLEDSVKQHFVTVYVYLMKHYGTLWNCTTSLEMWHDGPHLWSPDGSSWINLKMAWLSAFSPHQTMR